MPRMFDLSASYVVPSTPQPGRGFLSGLIGGIQQNMEERQAADALAPYLDSAYGTQKPPSTAGGFISKLFGGMGAPPAAVSPPLAGGIGSDAVASGGRGATASRINASVAGAPATGVPEVAGTPSPIAGTAQPRLPREAVERLLANPQTRALGMMLLPGGEADYRRQQAQYERDFDERKFAADQDYRRQSLDIQRSAGARANARLDDNAPRTTTIYDPESGQPVTAQWNAKTGSWDPIGGVKQPAPRPVPSAILKAEGEDLQDVQTIGQLNERLGGYIDQLDKGQLQLGPVQNKVAQLKNWAGNSDPASQAYASFMAGMEQMRNESLRLNKGVQTEGDAQRAWNELFANVNDPAVVKKRLEEIRDYNAKAAAFKNNQIGLRRATSNLPDLDTSTVLTAPGGGLLKSEQSSSPKEGQTATNPQTGARIIFRSGKWENM